MKKLTTYSCLEQFKILLLRKKYSTKELDNLAKEILLYQCGDDLKEDQIIQNMSYEHSLRVAHTAYALANYMHTVKPSIYTSDMPEKAYQAGLLHDLGKSKMPSIINKAGKLSDEERAEVEKHPKYSLQIIQEKCPGISRDIQEACLCHHLKLDGSGYPDCAKNRKHPISVLTQILTICDIYDAIRHPRSYKPENTLEKSLQIMRTQDVAEGQLNAELFAAFEKIIVMYEKSALHDKKIMVEEVK